MVGLESLRLGLGDHVAAALRAAQDAGRMVLPADVARLFRLPVAPGAPRGTRPASGAPARPPRDGRESYGAVEPVVGGHRGRPPAATRAAPRADPARRRRPGGRRGRAVVGLAGAARDLSRARGLRAVRLPQLAVHGRQPARFAAFYRNPKSVLTATPTSSRATALRLLNGSCPGETTGSYHDPATRSTSASRRPAPVVRPAAHRLRMGRSWTTRTGARGTRSPRVQLVTLQLGSNDAFLCQAAPPSSRGGGRHQWSRR